MSTFAQKKTNMRVIGAGSRRPTGTIDLGTGEAVIRVPMAIPTIGFKMDAEQGMLIYWTSCWFGVSDREHTNEKGIKDYPTIQFQTGNGSLPTNDKRRGLTLEVGNVGLPNLTLEDLDTITAICSDIGDTKTAEALSEAFDKAEANPLKAGERSPHTVRISKDILLRFLQNDEHMSACCTDDETGSDS